MGGLSNDTRTLRMFCGWLVCTAAGDSGKFLPAPYLIHAVDNCTTFSAFCIFPVAVWTGYKVGWLAKLASRTDSWKLTVLLVALLSLIFLHNLDQLLISIYVLNFY